MKKRRKSTRNTIPAWVLRDDPLFSEELIGSAALHVNCKCEDCKKRYGRKGS